MGYKCLVSRRLDCEHGGSPNVDVTRLERRLIACEKMPGNKFEEGQDLRSVGEPKEIPLLDDDSDAMLLLSKIIHCRNDWKCDSDVQSVSQAVRITLFMTLREFGGRIRPMDRILRTRTYGLKMQMTTKAGGTVSWNGETVLVNKIDMVDIGRHTTRVPASARRSRSSTDICPERWASWSCTVCG